MSSTTNDYPTDLPLIELLRIIPLAEAVRLSGISEDGLKRHYREKLLKLSPRRLGMRLGDALMLGEAKSGVTAA
jgi:hypothetical protein